jgi:sugar-specific transcriptional regulator TrmB
MDVELLDQVQKLAKREKRSQSLVVETAVARFFSPSDRPEVVIARRLDHLIRQLERIERYIAILAEYIRNVTRLWMRTKIQTLTTPDKAARAKSLELEAAVTRHVARSMVKDRPMVQEVSEDIDTLCRTAVSEDALDEAKH